MCFSFSLARSGRGLKNENKFTAIIPFSEDETYYQNLFFIVLHEYTHQFTDALLNTSINMEDGSHDLSEKVVILFDYYLISAINKPDIESYFAWIAKNSGNEGVKIDDSEFLSIFKVHGPLNNTLVSLVDDIISHK